MDLVLKDWCGVLQRPKVIQLKTTIVRGQFFSSNLIGAAIGRNFPSQRQRTYRPEAMITRALLIMDDTVAFLGESMFR